MAFCEDGSSLRGTLEIPKGWDPKSGLWWLQEPLRAPRVSARKVSLRPA